MDLNAFTDVPFEDPIGFAFFLQANDLAHGAVAQKLQQIGITIVQYPLSAMTPDSQVWLQMHQDVHQQELNLIAAANNQQAATYQVDLTAVDFKNEQAYNDWLQGHADIHAYVNSLLGL